MTGPNVPNSCASAIRGEVRRTSLTVSAVAVACLLASVVLAMFGDSPWESTWAVWTVFAVVALIRSQLALTRIDDFLGGSSM